MATLTARPRLAPAAAGKSGTRTLELPTLVQDKSRRAALQAADKAAYLSKSRPGDQVGGLQDPTTEVTPDIALQEEIRDLFGTNDWPTFCSL